MNDGSTGNLASVDFGMTFNEDPLSTNILAIA